MEGDSRPAVSKASQLTIIDAYRRSFVEAFGQRFGENVPLARYTSARIGGPAEFFAEASGAEDLVTAARLARGAMIPYTVLGGGSNVLVSDAGVRGLVILNRAQKVTFRHDGTHIVLRAESGAYLAPLVRQCVQRGLGGLEWAVGIPGTIGGAVFGNAGAHGGDVSHDLRRAALLDPDGAIVELLPEELRFEYRSSAIKRAKAREAGRAWIVLWAEFGLTPQPVEELEARASGYTEHRKRTQPPGASMGSMFKNPPGDYAGRLIDAAGLKGTRVGGAQISELHANFFVNLGNATASDVRTLINHARTTVRSKFGVELELEIELLGD